MHDPAHIDIAVSGARPKAADYPRQANYRGGGVEFDTPGAAERGTRLAVVSKMIYLMFNEGYGSTPASSEAREALADEAIRLGRLLLSLFPTDPEIFGLLALMLLQQSRAPARFDPNGDIVLLEEQDRGLWNRTLIDEGRLLLQRAAMYQNPGPYQLQAAIAALHVRATGSADTSWKEIASLYQALETLQPSPVVTLNRAVAVWKLQGPEVALKMIDPSKSELNAYFYFHGLRGTLLKELNRPDEAREALTSAIALAKYVAEAKLIRRELDHLAIARAPSFPPDISRFIHLGAATDSAVAAGRPGGSLRGNDQVAFKAGGQNAPAQGRFEHDRHRCNRAASACVNTSLACHRPYRTCYPRSPRLQP